MANQVCLNCGGECEDIDDMTPDEERELCCALGCHCVHDDASKTLNKAIDRVLDARWTDASTLFYFTEKEAQKELVLFRQRDNSKAFRVICCIPFDEEEVWIIQEAVRPRLVDDGLNR